MDAAQGNSGRESTHTGICEHFESSFNALNAIQPDLEQVLRKIWYKLSPSLKTKIL
jgi:hypothetical protein